MKALVGFNIGDVQFKNPKLKLNGLGLPPPFIPPLKGEGDFDISFFSVTSISSAELEREDSMRESPSPLRGGIEGGGERSPQN